MGLTDRCIVCNVLVKNDNLFEEFEGIYEKVDSLGEIYLTEKEQLVYRRQVCSRDCYKLL